MSTPDQAFINLGEAKTVLDGLGIVFWLDGGTLLGAHRDADFCADDHNDVDLSTWAANKHLIPDLISGMTARGFRMYHHWSGDSRAPGMAQEVSFTRNGLKIDVFFHERSGDVAWHCIYVAEVCRPVVVPLVLLAGFEPIMFRGVEFLRPARIDEYLTFRYGDWRTPVHRSQYTSSDPAKFAALQPDWPFWEHCDG